MQGTLSEQFMLTWEIVSVFGENLFRATQVNVYANQKQLENFNVKTILIKLQFRWTTTVDEAKHLKSICQNKLGRKCMQ